MTRREIDPRIGNDSSSVGAPQEPAEMRETLSNVSKLAHIIADVAGGKSDYELNQPRVPGGHSISTPPRGRKTTWPNPVANRGPDTTPLKAIGSTFEELRDTIPDVRQKSATALADVLDDVDLADKIDEIIQPIEERLLDIAWQSHALPSQSPADLRVKAEILKFVASDEPDDIQSALTRSLCNDIISRTSKRSDPDTST